MDDGQFREAVRLYATTVSVYALIVILNLLFVHPSTGEGANAASGIIVALAQQFVALLTLDTIMLSITGLIVKRTSCSRAQFLEGLYDSLASISFPDLFSIAGLLTAFIAIAAGYYAIGIATLIFMPASTTYIKAMLDYIDSKLYSCKHEDE